jgi:hypothetical protein
MLRTGFFISLALVGLMSPPALAEALALRPNIIFVMAGDLGNADLCHTALKSGLRHFPGS